MRRSSLVEIAAALLLCGCGVGSAPGPGQVGVSNSAAVTPSPTSPSPAFGPTLTSTPSPTRTPSKSPAATTPGEQPVAGVIVATNGTGWTSAGLQGPEFAAGACHMRRLSDGQYLPDPRCTPGAIDSRVTQSNLAVTICHSGYSTSVRPPSSLTTPSKRESMLEYDASGPLSAFEYDHLVPLSLGGSSSRWNLWVEPNIGGTGGYYINAKDIVEAALHRAVCNGSVGLHAAQVAIATNWETAEASLGL